MLESSPLRAMKPLSAAASRGLPLRIATARWPPVRTGARSCRTRPAKHLFPESREIVVDHGRWDQAGVDHLQKVVVLQAFRRFLDDDGRAAGGLEAPVERLEAVEIARAPANEDPLSAELAEGSQRGPSPGR